MKAGTAPHETNNIAGDPFYQETKDNLKTELFERLKAQEDPRMFGRGYVFDEYPYGNDRNVNFYQRYIMEGEEIPIGWVNDSDFEDKLLPEQTQ